MKNFLYIRNKGQISVLTAIITSVGIMGASLFTSWATASKKTSEISARVMVVENTEALHYQKLSEDLTKIDTKLNVLIDKLLEKKI